MSEEERYQKLANERQTALDQSNKTYEDLLNKNTDYTNSYNQYLTDYQNTQNDIYDKQTQFQVDLQNQNKEKAEREYQKEAQASKNAYFDFINPYGVQAEIQAQNGLNNSGYSETVKSQAWTTQQNRTAKARASLNEAKLQFDNAIKEAYLNNDTLKAELALKMLQQKQEEALRSFNYVSDTVQNRLTNNQNIDSDYNNRYNTLYSQIQDEKAQAEAIRQWEAEMAFKKEQAAQEQANWEREYELSKYNTYNSGNNGIDISNDISSETTVNPYTGTLNKDAAKGTFSNGYQPNNVNGVPLENVKVNGKKLKVSDIFANSAYGSTGISLANQSIWKAGNKYYVWDGSIDDYVDVTSKVAYSLKNPGPQKW